MYSDDSGYYGKLYNNLKKAIEEILPYIAQIKVCSDKSERFRWWPKENLLVYHHKNGAHVGLNKEELADYATYETVDFIANFLAEEFLVAAASLKQRGFIFNGCHGLEPVWSKEELSTVDFSSVDLFEYYAGDWNVTYKNCFAAEDVIDFEELIRVLNEHRKRIAANRSINVMAISVAADIEGTASTVSEQVRHERAVRLRDIEGMANTVSEHEIALPEKQIKKFSELIIYEASERGLDLDKVFKDAYFSKSYKHQILNDKFINAGKDKTINLAFALHMTPDEAKAFIGHEDHTFSSTDKRDQFLLECLENKNWDILTVNERLFKMGLRPLPV